MYFILPETVLTVVAAVKLVEEELVVVFVVVNVEQELLKLPFIKIIKYIDINQLFIIIFTII